MGSPSFRDDELRDANDAAQALVPGFLLLLVSYCVGQGMGLKGVFATLAGLGPTYLVVRIWSYGWHRWAVPFLERSGL
jgi:hypothetical protein